MKVVTSKTFDNATSCSSENSLVIVDDVYENAIEALQEEGGVLLDHEETQEFKDNLWIQGKLNPHLIAKSASEVATVVGFQEATSSISTTVANFGGLAWSRRIREVWFY